MNAITTQIVSFFASGSMFTINIFPHSRIRQARGKQSTEKQKQNGIVLKPTDLSILLTEFAAYCQHRSCIFRSYNYILIPAPRSLTPWATIVLIVNVALMFFFFPTIVNVNLFSLFRYWLIYCIASNARSQIHTGLHNTKRGTLKIKLHISFREMQTSLRLHSNSITP